MRRPVPTLCGPVSHTPGARARRDLGLLGQPRGATVNGYLWSVANVFGRLDAAACTCAHRQWWWRRWTHRVLGARQCHRAHLQCVAVRVGVAHKCRQTRCGRRVPPAREEASKRVSGHCWALAGAARVSIAAEHGGNIQ